MILNIDNSPDKKAKDLLIDSVMSVEYYTLDNVRFDLSKIDSMSVNHNEFILADNIILESRELDLLPDIGELIFVNKVIYYVISRVLGLNEKLITYFVIPIRNTYRS